MASEPPKILNIIAEQFRRLGGVETIRGYIERNTQFILEVANYHRHWARKHSRLLLPRVNNLCGPGDRQERFGIDFRHATTGNSKLSEGMLDQIERDGDLANDAAKATIDASLGHEAQWYLLTLPCIEDAGRGRTPQSWPSLAFPTSTVSTIEL